MGVSHDKMTGFTFVDETYDVRNIPDDIEIDHAFECVGGNGSTKAIDQIIDYIKPEGTIAILGVSENPVPINTRMILEKGLRMFGSSRSGRKDFAHQSGIFFSSDESRYLSVGGDTSLRYLLHHRKYLVYQSLI